MKHASQLSADDKAAIAAEYGTRLTREIADEIGATESAVKETAWAMGLGDPSRRGRGFVLRDPTPAPPKPRGWDAETVAWAQANELRDRQAEYIMLHLYAPCRPAKGAA